MNGGQTNIIGNIQLSNGKLSKLLLGNSPESKYELDAKATPEEIIVRS